MTDLIDILYYEATGKVLTKEERMKIDEMRGDENDKQKHTKESRKAVNRKLSSNGD